MGLTIHYTLRSKDSSNETIRNSVARLRSRAMDLPFVSVGPLIELAGDQCDLKQHGPRSSLRWLLCQAQAWIEVGGRSLAVRPTQLVAFTTSPGAGCEPANFGLCRFPKTIKIPGATPGQRTKRVPTHLDGARWESFCKTQYASSPACGGLKNFLRSHDSVITLLDHARELGILGNVNDEGEYWTNRNAVELAREVGLWNRSLAALAGRLKDLSGNQLLAEITQFPDFEHLEAEGQGK